MYSAHTMKVSNSTVARLWLFAWGAGWILLLAAVPPSSYHRMMSEPNFAWNDPFILVSLTLGSGLVACLSGTVLRNDSRLWLALIACVCIGFIWSSIDPVDHLYDGTKDVNPAQSLLLQLSWLILTSATGWLLRPRARWQLRATISGICASSALVVLNVVDPQSGLALGWVSASAWPGILGAFAVSPPLRWCLAAQRSRHPTSG